jgi:antitoxin MazE
LQTSGNGNYNVIMQTKLVPIGNSKGLRIPKAVLQQANITDNVELRVVGDKLVITSPKRKRRPRQGWARAIAEEIDRAGAPEVDAGLAALANDWDAEGWKW